MFLSFVGGGIQRILNLDPLLINTLQNYQDLQSKVPLLLIPSVAIKICAHSCLQQIAFRNMLAKFMKSKVTPHHATHCPLIRALFQAGHWRSTLRSSWQIIPAFFPQRSRVVQWVPLSAPPTNLAHQRLRDHLSWPFWPGQSDGFFKKLRRNGGNNLTSFFVVGQCLILYIHFFSGGGARFAMIC